MRPGGGDYPITGDGGIMRKAEFAEPAGFADRQDVREKKSSQGHRQGSNQNNSKDEVAFYLSSLSTGLHLSSEIGG